MANYSKQRITKAFTASDNAASTTARGQLLEELVAYLFSKCPGVRHFKSDALNSAGSSEIDVCFWNNGHNGSIDFLPKVLVVECKNTGERIGSAAVRIFRDKLHDMHLEHGILIAAQGITGDAQNLRAAHDVVRTAFQREKVSIIVLTRAELESLQTTNGLIRLLQEKVLLLTMQAKTFDG